MCQVDPRSTDEMKRFLLNLPHGKAQLPLGWSTTASTETRVIKSISYRMASKAKKAHGNIADHAMRHIVMTFGAQSAPTNAVCRKSTKVVAPLSKQYVIDHQIIRYTVEESDA